MTAVPYYLQPTVTSSVPMSVEESLNVKWDYDYGYINQSGETTDFWSQLAYPVNSAKDFVWDTAAGTWDTIKSTGVSVIDTIKEGAESAAGGIFSFLDSALIRIVLIFAVIVAALIFLGKAGVIKDIGGLFKP